MITLLLLFHL
jgi:hypothetical protein